MTRLHGILIHEFDLDMPPRYDEDGDQMIGYYFQFINDEDNPVTNLIGPYSQYAAAEKAAKRELGTKDY